MARPRSRAPRPHGPDLCPARAGQEDQLFRGNRIRRCRVPCTRTTSACNRSSITFCRTLSNSRARPRQAPHHAGTVGLELEQSELRKGARSSPSSSRTPASASGGQTAHHLRGFPAGRCTTSRKYGGTALAFDQPRDHLAPRRRADRYQRPGQGSAFTLFMPVTFRPQAQVALAPPR